MPTIKTIKKIVHDLHSFTDSHSLSSIPNHSDAYEQATSEKRESCAWTVFKEMINMIDPSTTKYLIKTKITADGVVEKPDVIGAIFGQTEGLLGEELDLRDLQKGARIGRIEVEVKSEGGRSVGEVLIPSSLDQVDTAILAAALETIDRIGPARQMYMWRA